MAGEQHCGTVAVAPAATPVPPYIICAGLCLVIHQRQGGRIVVIVHGSRLHGLLEGASRFRRGIREVLRVEVLHSILWD